MSPPLFETLAALADWLELYPCQLEIHCGNPSEAFRLATEIRRACPLHLIPDQLALPANTFTIGRLIVKVLP